MLVPTLDMLFLHARAVHGLARLKIHDHLQFASNARFRDYNAFTRATTSLSMLTIFTPDLFISFFASLQP